MPNVDITRNWIDRPDVSLYNVFDIFSGQVHAWIYKH